MIEIHQYGKQTASRKATRLVALTYAVARRPKPKARAKVAGKPWSVMESLGALEGRALRAKRCFQERRQWARWARVKMSSVGTSECVGVAAFSKSTLSLRTSFIQARRMRQRGQSFHNTEARGGEGGTVSRGGETSEEEESGHNTALTRRGLIVALLS